MGSGCTRSVFKVLLTRTDSFSKMSMLTPGPGEGPKEPGWCLECLGAMVEAGNQVMQLQAHQVRGNETPASLSRNAGWMGRAVEGMQSHHLWGRTPGYRSRTKGFQGCQDSRISYAPGR